MYSVSDICKDHFLCFVAIMQVKVILDYQATKVNPKNVWIYIELRYMLLGQIFAKNTKNEPQTLFEASKSVTKLD